MDAGRWQVPGYRIKFNRILHAFLALLAIFIRSDNSCAKSETTKDSGSSARRVPGDLDGGRRSLETALCRICLQAKWSLRKTNQRQNRTHGSVGSSCRLRPSRFVHVSNEGATRPTFGFPLKPITIQLSGVIRILRNATGPVEPCSSSGPVGVSLPVNILGSWVGPGSVTFS